MLLELSFSTSQQCPNLELFVKYGFYGLNIILNIEQGLLKIFSVPGVVLVIRLLKLKLRSPYDETPLD